MNIEVPHAGQDESRNASPLTSLFAKHDVLFFFVLAFAFSWLIYLCVWLIGIDQVTVLSRWLLIAAFGPSVAAIVVARIAGPQEEARRSIGMPALFALAFAVGIGIELLDHKWWAHRISPALIVADVVMVSLAACVVSAVLSRRRGVRELMQGLVRWRVGPSWYFVAILLWPAIVVAGNALARGLGMGVPAAPTFPSGIPLIPLVIESFLWYLLFGGPLNEESGWRGFALSRLQLRLSPLTAGVIVGAAWGLWHLPLHLMGVYPMGPVGAVIRVFDIPRAILFTWLFNRTRRSLLPVLLLHAATNTTSLFLSRNFVTSSLLMLVLAVVVVFTDRMWRRGGLSGAQSSA